MYLISAEKKDRAVRYKNGVRFTLGNFGVRFTFWEKVSNFGVRLPFGKVSMVNVAKCV